MPINTNQFHKAAGEINRIRKAGHQTVAANNFLNLLAESKIESLINRSEGLDIMAALQNFDDHHQGQIIGALKNKFHLEDNFHNRFVFGDMLRNIGLRDQALNVVAQFDREQLNPTQINIIDEWLENIRSELDELRSHNPIVA